MYPTRLTIPRNSYLSFEQSYTEDVHIASKNTNKKNSKNKTKQANQTRETKLNNNNKNIASKISK